MRSWKRCLVCSHIDGTTNLIYHYMQSAVSLGLYENGKITFGIVYNPFSKETFTAVEGKGAYLNGKRIHTSTCDCLKDALICYGSSPYEKERAHGRKENSLPIWKTVIF